MDTCLLNTVVFCLCLCVSPVHFRPTSKLQIKDTNGWTGSLINVPHCPPVSHTAVRASQLPHCVPPLPAGEGKHPQDLLLFLPAHKHAGREAHQMASWCVNLLGH